MKLWFEDELGFKMYQIYYCQFGRDDKKVSPIVSLVCLRAYYLNRVILGVIFKSQHAFGRMITSSVKFWSPLEAHASVVAITKRV